MHLRGVDANWIKVRKILFYKFFAHIKKQFLKKWKYWYLSKYNCFLFYLEFNWRPISVCNSQTILGIYNICSLEPKRPNLNLQKWKATILEYSNSAFCFKDRCTLMLWSKNEWYVIKYFRLFKPLPSIRREFFYRTTHQLLFQYTTIHHLDVSIRDWCLFATLINERFSTFLNMTAVRWASSQN